MNLTWWQIALLVPLTMFWFYFVVRVISFAVFMSWWDVIEKRKKKLLEEMGKEGKDV